MKDTGDYIPRKAAIKAVSENDCEGYATWAVKAIPAADVRPVVLCRDCKCWELSKIDPPFHVCTYVCGATFVREAEDFCSRGEKKEES